VDASDGAGQVLRKPPLFWFLGKRKGQRDHNANEYLDNSSFIKYQVDRGNS